MQRRNRALCIVLCLAASPLGAQNTPSTQSIVGKWSVMWDSDIRMDHDTAIVKSRRPATLELTQRGDSVFGTWSGSEAQGTQLRGTFDGRGFKLTSGVVERMGQIDGKPTKMKVRWDVNGAMRGEGQGAQLAGTMFVYLGDRPPPLRRWEGQRSGSMK